MAQFLKVCLICIASLVCLFETAYSDLPLPLEVDVYYIKFNYGAGHTYDALDIRENYSTNVDVPEWYNSPFRNEKIAYIKGQSSRKIKVKFYDNNDNLNSMKVYADASGQPIGDIPETSVSFGGSQYSNETMMTFDSSAPGSVGKRYFVLVWYVTEVNGSSVEDTYIYDSGNHNYYTVLAAPQSPMAEPWTEVLDYACDWASGKSSESSALTEITKGAYNDFGNDHEYDGEQTHTNGTTFYLTSFLSDNDADCQDVSAVVQVFTQAIGGTSTQVRKILGDFSYYDDGDEYQGFKTKPILAIGLSQWSFQRWNFHQVGYLNNVYDACLKLKQSSPRIPVNENINGSYKNDLFDLGGWHPQNTWSYTTVN